MIKRLARGALKIYRHKKSFLARDEDFLNADKNLSNLLRHAYQHVPYYRAVFKQIGLIANDQPDLSKFKQIPVLTKKIIREYQNSLVSDDILTRVIRENTSGGSTGEPVRLIQDECYTYFRRLTQKYYYENFLNIDEDDTRKVILWGSEKDIFQQKKDMKAKFLNWIENTVFLNSFKMSDEIMRRYVKEINEYKPVFIRGYAGSMYLLSCFIEKNHLEIHAPKFIVSSAETLSDDMRLAIERVWRTKVYNYYGSREVNGLAGECRKEAMHVFSFWNHVEILDEESRPVIDGKPGRVVVTNLHNYAMPLIRYEIGDIAVVGTNDCDCGKRLPILQKISGRITDHFFKKDGTVIHGEYFTHLFYGKGWVQQFQIIQLNYDQIVIKLVSKGEVPAVDKHDIETKIRLLMGNNCLIVWDNVKEIDVTESGKFLYTRSLVNG